MFNTKTIWDMWFAKRMNPWCFSLRTLKYLLYFDSNKKNEHSQQTFNFVTLLPFRIHDFATNKKLFANRIIVDGGRARSESESFHYAWRLPSGRTNNFNGISVIIEQMNLVCSTVCLFANVCLSLKNFSARKLRSRKKKNKVFWC